VQIKVRHRVALIRRQIKRLAAIEAERTSQAESMLVSDRFRSLSEAETAAIWAANCWEDPRASLAYRIRYFHESARTQLSRGAVAGVKARAYARAQREARAAESAAKKTGESSAKLLPARSLPTLPG
jgi:hypothetical protein